MMAKGQFHGSANKVAVDAQGRPYVRVKHNDQFFRVNFAKTAAELSEVKALDDRYYSGAQQLTEEELRILPKCGHVLFYRHPKSGEMVAACQILFQSISRQEVRMNEAFSFGTVGRGYGQILYKAQEVVAREAGKQLIRATVRVENTEAIRAQLKSGYRIIEYDPTRYGLTEEGGARLVMSKDLVNEYLPFRPKRKANEVLEGKIPILTSRKSVEKALKNDAFRVGVYVWNEERIRLNSHRLIQQVMQSGYIGVALLLPEEIDEPPGPRKLIIFHRKDAPPTADRLGLPVTVYSEFGQLREVIVSFTPENAQIREEYAINDVAKKNVNNIDPIAFKDEYNLFVGTLVDHGVRVVHTNAIGSAGKSAIFTRDPAMSIGKTFVIGRLRQKQREYELDGMREVASNYGVAELSNGHAAFVEGGDVIFIGEKKLVVGLGQRSNEAGLAKLRKLLPEYEFIPVKHSDLHLDVLFTVVGRKKCLADITRLPGDFIELLLDDGYIIVEADPDEQITLGCNVVCLDDHKVIAAKENVETIRRLKAHGVTVIEVSMPNIVKWGGGPRCMTCPTNRGDNGS